MEIKGFIIGRKSGQDWHCLFVTTADCMHEYGYITICEHTINFEFPEGFNLTAAQMRGLEAERDRLKADFNARIAHINDEISKLQAICYDAPEEKE